MGAVEIEEAAKVLAERSKDLSYLAGQITARTRSMKWECAKRERFDGAMRARREEARSLSWAVEELSRALRAHAEATPQAGG